MSDVTCPFLNGPCIKDRCALWTQVLGQHPQTGEVVNKAACSLSFLPMLLIENSQQQRQTGAAIESFRNSMADDAQRTHTALQQMVGGGKRYFPMTELLDG